MDDKNLDNNSTMSNAEQRKQMRSASNRRSQGSSYSVNSDDSMNTIGFSFNPSGRSSAPKDRAPSSEGKSREVHADTDSVMNSRQRPSSAQGAAAGGQLPENRYSGETGRQPRAYNSFGSETHKKPVMSSTRRKQELEAERQREFADKKALKEKKKRRRRRRFSVVKFILSAIVLLAIIAFITLGIMAINIITHAEDLNPDDIYANVSENSVMYDSNGEAIENIMDAELRTNLDYDQMPDTLLSSFIAIEDKTFWKHHGFNWIRLGGAVIESVKSGNRVAGTSTITQQLARNIFLSDIKSERTLSRKLKEAYYTVLMEKKLDKKQIIEAYLNTIYLGFNTYGVEAAAQTYFGKSASELTLAECSALACIPKNPTGYALIKRYYASEVDPANSNIIATQGDYILVYNDAFKERQLSVLENMVAQGYITQDQANEAYSYDLQQSINPPSTIDSNKQTSSYYTDYVKDEVVDILVEQMEISQEEATAMLYSGGLKIYTALDPDIQNIVETVFANTAYFPSAVTSRRDSSGNILNSDREIMLYNYTNYYNSDGSFTFNANEYSFNSAGDLVIYRDNRLSFNKTTVDGEVSNININFKPTYVRESGLVYISSSGQMNIDAAYKSEDNQGNLIISKKFITDYPDAFVDSGSSLTVSAKYVTISEKVIQPQGAMVIMDQTNGCIAAMVGGRNIQGNKLYNRADSARQAGSSIKPLAVYTPAILKGYTGSTIVADSPHYVNGKLWPKNSYSGYKGNITVRNAVQVSSNVASVKVLEDIGIETSYNFLKSLGITTLREEDKSLAALGLGGLTNGLKPVESCGAYATIANGGVYNRPTTVTKIVDRNGNIIYDLGMNKTRTVFDEATAFLMTDILKSVVSSGTGSRAKISGGNSSIPVAGKTGTTTANYDAWFCGFTPYYTAVVWIGNDYNIQLSNGSGAAASLWSAVMKQVHSGLEAKSFVQPETVGKHGDYYVIGRETVGNKGSSYTPKEEEEEDDEDAEGEEGEEGEGDNTNGNNSNNGNNNGNGSTNGNNGNGNNNARGNNNNNNNNGNNNGGGGYIEIPA